MIFEGCKCPVEANDYGRGFEQVAAVERLEDIDAGELLVRGGPGAIFLERGWKIDPDCPVHGEASA